MTEMSWLLFAGLTFGGVMGWGARDMHFLASKETTAQKHKEALKEKDVEIRRLREQVARIIGVEK